MMVKQILLITTIIVCIYSLNLKHQKHAFTLEDIKFLKDKTNSKK
jgi:hypothetical protein